MNKPEIAADVANLKYATDAAGPADLKVPFHVGVFSRRRWQVLIGLLVAVGIPGFILWWDSSFRVPTSSLSNAVLGTTFAVLAGYFLVRRLAIFPGLQVFSFILPSFAISYGIMAAVLLLSRADYSRFQVFTSFAFAVGFYHYAFLVERRLRRPRFAVLAGGHIAETMLWDKVDWLVWQSPDQLPHEYDGLVVDLRNDMPPEWETFIARCALSGIPVYHSKQVHEWLTGQVSVEHLSENTFGSLVPSKAYWKAKFVADVLVSIVILPFAAIVCGLAAILIKLDSPGPVLFVQKRVGYRGRIFRMYKLRTMGADSEGNHYTSSEDPRVTRVGALLRRYRIDELPQILNILKGEMSLIGPRPEAVELSNWYEREIPFYSYRHIVRPGISGWAQVNQGNVARPENVKYKLRYDFYYIKNFSPWLDAVIAAQSIRIILSGFGSR